MQEIRGYIWNILRADADTRIVGFLPDQFHNRLVDPGSGAHRVSDASPLSLQEAKVTDNAI